MHCNYVFYNWLTLLDTGSFHQGLHAEAHLSSEMWKEWPYGGMIVFDKNALRVWCWIFFFIIQTSSWDGGNCNSMKWCEGGPHAEKLQLWHFLPIKIRCPIFWSCWETVLCSLEWGVFRYLFADMLYDLESIRFTIGSCVSILIDLNQEKFSVPMMV